MLNLTLERIERQIRNLPVEHVYVLDADYNVVFNRTDGRYDRVTLSFAEVAAMRGGILTHNHPGGRSFSPEDVELAHGAELLEVRVVTARRRYSLKPPAGGWESVPARVLADTIREEEDLLSFALDAEIARGLITTRLDGARVPSSPVAASCQTRDHPLRVRGLADLTGRRPCTP